MDNDVHIKQINVMSKYNKSHENLCLLITNLNVELKLSGSRSNVYLLPSINSEDMFMVCFPENDFMVGVVEKNNGVWNLVLIDEMFKMYKQMYGFWSEDIIPREKVFDFVTTEDF